MKKWLKIINREEYFIVALILIYVFLAYFPFLLQFFAHPPLNRIFLGSFGFPPDFWGNIISLQEGRLGHLTFLPKVTTTITTSPTLLKPEYRFLGWLNAIIPISQVLIFHLSRLVLSLVLLGIIYKLITKIFKTKTERLVAFILALFSTSAGPDGQNLVYMWSPLGVFQRLAYYPHYLFGMIFILLAILYLSEALKTKKISKLGLACLFGFLTSWIHAGNIATLYLALPFSVLLILFETYRNKLKYDQLVNKFIYLFVFCLISGLPLLYIYLTSQIFPWSMLSKSDLKFNMSTVTNFQEMVTGVGPTFVLGLIGSVVIIKKKNNLLRLILPWSFVYIIGFFFFWRIIAYNGNRFLQTPFFVILAILTTFTLKWTAEKIFKKNILYQQLFIWISVALILLVSLPAYARSWETNRVNFEPVGDYLYYSQPGNLAVIDWLAKNTKENDIVLADKINAELVAALAGNNCYITVHATELPNFYDLENKVIFFYRQTDPQQAQAFLKANNIKYVMWTDNERILANTKDFNYPFLTKVFEFENASLWKVNNY